MGCVLPNQFSSTAENKSIERHLKLKFEDEKKQYKLLLLGTGLSGKSTLFKSFKSSRNQLSAEDIQKCLCPIRKNLVNGIYILLQNAYSLYQEDSIEYKQCKLDLDDETLKEIQLIYKELNNNDYITGENIGKIIYKIWKMPEIQNTFKYKEVKFRLPENLEYFLNKSESIMLNDYQANLDDCLYVSIRTAGMVSYHYSDNKNEFVIMDVGGQRNERKKWIHHFDLVNGVLFVAALNHFCCNLFEDNSKNALHESLDLWHTITSSKYLRRASMVLILNKTDLFEKMLKQHSLRVCFGKGVKGWNGINGIVKSNSIQENTFNNGPFLVGPDYKKRDDELADKQHFTEVLAAANNFILSLFFKINAQNQVSPRQIYHHFTCATDTTAVSQVFKDVQHTAIYNNLSKGGLMV